MTRSFAYLRFALALAIATPAAASDLDVVARAPDGTPVADAVVTVHLVGRPTPTPRPEGSYAVDQSNIQFHAFVTIVPTGAAVSFLNHDAVRHHVYSFSAAKRFELKLAGREQNRRVVFDKAGVVPLGCNIHDRMIGFVDVVDTPWSAKTDVRGHALIRGLPAGSVKVTLWHPYLRAPGNTVDQAASLPPVGTARQQFTASLRSPPRPPTISDY